MSTEYIIARLLVLKKHSRLGTYGLCAWVVLIMGLICAMFRQVSPFHDVTPQMFILLGLPLCMLAVLLGMCAHMWLIGREIELTEVSSNVDAEMREYARAFPAAAHYLDTVKAMGRSLVQADVIQIMTLDPILIRLAKAETQARRARK